MTLTKGGYFGIIIDTIDSEHFKVKTDKGEERVVEIFDVRSME